MTTTVAAEPAAAAAAPAAAAAAPAAGTPAAAPAAAAAAAPAAKPGESAAAAPKPGDAPAAQKSLLDEAGEPAAPKPGEAAPKPGEKPQGAPEAYTEYKLPEGMVLDPALATKANEVFKKHNLSQETAQDLVTLQAEYAKTTAETLVSEATQKRDAQIEAWKTETKTALGAEWKKELGFASKALDAFWSPEVRKLLTLSGFGDHPQFVPGLVKLGKALSEGQPGEGSRAGITDPKESGHRAMFPKMYDAQGNYIGGAK